MKFAEEMKDIVKGKLLVTLTAFGNTNNGGNIPNQGDNVSISVNIYM